MNSITSPLYPSAFWWETVLLRRAARDISEEATGKELGPCTACGEGLELMGRGGGLGGGLVGWGGRQKPWL